MTQSKYFYHYTTVEGLMGIIENKCLWATGIDFLNDPSETHYIEDLIKQICIKSPDLKKVYEYFFNESYKSVFFDSTSIYITSMSAAWDSLSMWNYYAKGNGYCLKFKKSDLFKTNLSDEDEFYSDMTMDEIKIVYNSTTQIESLESILGKYIQKIPEYEKLIQNIKLCREQDNEIEFHEYNDLLSDLESSFMDDLYKNRFFYKHPSYEREQEIRIVCQYDAPTAFEKKFRSTASGQLIDYIELPINLANIEEVMIHPIISDEVHRIGLRGYLYHNGLYNTKVTPSLIPFRNL